MRHKPPWYYFDMEEIVGQVAELGGTVFVVSSFLLYLYIKNGKTERNQEKIANLLDTQTRVLIKVSRNHGLADEADNLMVRGDDSNS